MADNVKIFISWSGDLSREITKVLRIWLPKMFDRVEPWMSDIDVAAGSRALKDIEDRLNESDFGVIVVTTENHEKPWLNFEAGALSKRFDGSIARVVPLLVNFDDFYQVTTTIRQFQGVMLQKDEKPYKDGVRKLLQSISTVAGADWPAVEARFDWSWDEFAEQIEAAKTRAGSQPEPPEVDERALLIDLAKKLDSITRNQAKPSTTKGSYPFDHSDRDELRHAIHSIHRLLADAEFEYGTLELNADADIPTVVIPVKDTDDTRISRAQVARRIRRATGFRVQFQLTGAPRYLGEDDVSK
jgi:hypothetical protein